MKLNQISKLWGKLAKSKYLFFAGLLLFALLLYKDPFSQRSLIPNMEPYPDTFHYIVPVRSLLQGRGFKLWREFGETNPVVSPLYSVVLMPFYLINQDVRMFYFANVTLSLLSLFLFYVILKKLTNNIWVIGLALFLFVTNYYLYWYPQWAMAENLILPVFLGALILLLSETNKRNLVLAGLVGTFFYGIKFAYLPISFIFVLLYATKVVIKKKGKVITKMNITSLIILFSSFSALFILLFGYKYLMSGTRFIVVVMSYVSKFFSSFSGTGEAELKAASASAWFSTYYFKLNLPRYIKGLLGSPTRFLWDFTPIWPKWISASGLIGLLFGLVKKRFRLFSFSLLVMLLGQLLFMSSFYTIDMRYLYHGIPTLLLGFVLFLVIIYESFKREKYKKVFNVLIVLLLTISFLGYVQRIKNQIVLNIKYAEVPWSYISVLKLNDYFSDERTAGSVKPVVISPMVPYYIDYYSNGNYDLLPLSPQQEFRTLRELIWGPGDYSDLHGLYGDYLKKEKDLYVATYGLGVEGYLHAAFNQLDSEFALTEVFNGCYEQCKIYKVEFNK